MRSLDPPEFNLDIESEVLAITELFDAEWHNGGFSQFFSNWNPSDASLVPEGLRRLGVPEAAKVVADAIAAMSDDMTLWRKPGHAALVGSDTELRQRLWALNYAFDPYEKALTAAMERYERMLARKSGDPFVYEDET
jgi:hypothetical protein